MISTTYVSTTTAANLRVLRILVLQKTASATAIKIDPKKDIGGGSGTRPSDKNKTVCNVNGRTIKETDQGKLYIVKNNKRVYL